MASVAIYELCKQMRPTYEVAVLAAKPLEHFGHTREVGRQSLET
jgi:hypothetical protein